MFFDENKLEAFVRKYGASVHVQTVEGGWRGTVKVDGHTVAEVEHSVLEQLPCKLAEDFRTRLGTLKVDDATPACQADAMSVGIPGIARARHEARAVVPKGEPAWAKIKTGGE
jgi:hypothetical protein